MNKMETILKILSRLNQIRLGVEKKIPNAINS